jgi:hypothetical protein
MHMTWLDTHRYLEFVLLADLLVGALVVVFALLATLRRHEVNELEEASPLTGSTAWVVARIQSGRTGEVMCLRDSVQRYYGAISLNDEVLELGTEVVITGYVSGRVQVRRAASNV